jgi:protein CpxP
MFSAMASTAPAKKPLSREKCEKVSSHSLLRLQRNTLSLGPLSRIAAEISVKPMKRIFALRILMAASIAFAVEAGSQERDPTPSETTMVGRSANDVLNVLAKRLSLTEEQKSKILPIIIERRRKIEEVWTSSTLFVRQKQVQVRGINEASDRRINALLTGDQQKAYFAFEQERKVQRRIRRAQSEGSS